jgi:hypothetical protein
MLSCQARESDPPIKDLNSSPWKDNPILVQSAWKRTKGLLWKWKRIINGGRRVREARTERQWPVQKLSAEELAEERKWKASSRARNSEKNWKRSAKKGGAGDDADDKEDEDDEE